VILGVGERIEIWDKAEWERYYAERRELLEDISEEIDFDL
jgi:DNA-binding transcriptional regulator/RsmH inhibitor MraZ